MSEEIKIIVKENVVLYYPDDEKGVFVCLTGSQVGVKIRLNGEWYGSYVVYAKPKLGADDVKDAANALFQEILTEVLKKGGAE